MVWVAKIGRHATGNRTSRQAGYIWQIQHKFRGHTTAEKGVDQRYMQQLLGHESSKTTKIYTHSTHKGRDTIKSPIEDFNILKIFFVCRFAK
jgi:site-specific recombinase XerD